jgi:hypothetical protein
MSQRRTIPNWHRLPVVEKVRVTRLSAPPALWRCCSCGVKVLSQDQAGHAAREHQGRARFERVS